MRDTEQRAIAIVGLSAILPDAPDADAFWKNVQERRYSISEVSPERWDPELYYDPDPNAPDKTYSKIGGWVREWEWDPMGWRLPIPPKVVEAMDVAQRWAVACARAALLDYGYPERELDRERTAVVIGNAMAGERHYQTALRVHSPFYLRLLERSPAFRALPAEQQRALRDEVTSGLGAALPEITEDSMPGELANCLAGRIANVFDLRGPNFVCDAACAAALAAISAAVEGLVEEEYDSVLVGGVDRNMGPEPFVKFCKIGALSATGTRPYADGADGFVMGEGAAFFLLKRLADAERAGDRIYAVLRGIGGASDGRGKGITAPNPVGQRLALERAWANAGLPPSKVGLIEGHGTSTRVGDVVEVESLTAVFGSPDVPPGSIPLGSVKSNIGHLKGAAGAAGLLKTVFALHHKVLPPSLNFERPSPNIDFQRTPFYVNTDLKPWDPPADGVRRAGVSAFGFGGTNYHAVLEEHVPGRLTSDRRPGRGGAERAAAAHAASSARAPLRGALVLGAATPVALRERLERAAAEAAKGTAPEPGAPLESDLRAAERIAIDYGNAAELAQRAERALRAFERDEPGVWKMLRSQGVFRGSGPAPKVAFLYTGQGSQYANMLRDLREIEPLVASTFDEADAHMADLIDRPLSDYLFPDPADPEAVARAEEDLRRTEITQPSVLAVDAALTRLLAAYGIQPDFVMGHSLGEYGALVAAGSLSFANALEAVSARGREMASLSVEDNGRMAAVMTSLDEIQRVIDATEGNIVIANMNSSKQAVIGGATAPVEQAMAELERGGATVVPLPVSHAFHTSIVAPASEPLRRTLERLSLAPPSIPLVSNVDGEFYPMGPDAQPRMLDLLAAQVASPVQFVKGLETLYAAGARLFVEVGPKKALHGFAEDVLGAHDDALALFTNHPKQGGPVSFNQALCGLWAAGLGVGRAEVSASAPAARAERTRGEPVETLSPPPLASVPSPTPVPATPAPAAPSELAPERYAELGRLFAEFLERGVAVYRGAGESVAREPVVVTGASLGLPGTDRVFDDANVQGILDGHQGIDAIPNRFRQAMVDKHITRLVKSESGSPHFETIDGASEVIKLAARAGRFDLEQEFGIPAERIPALDLATKLAIAAGLEALRNAGIPLVMHYRTTTKGTQLPERWMLPESLRDSTGVIFASAFPGADAFADELDRFHEDRTRRERLRELQSLRARLTASANGGDVLRSELDRRIQGLEAEIARAPYTFDRRFLFRVLAMGHSQFAEYVGARGPNTQINSACASTTQAFALAEDWIRAGRCRRVVVLAADDVTSDRLIEWIGAGFLATGAAATDDVVEEAALPFDQRRHGMILGMGAAGILIESREAAAERGLRPICEVLGVVTANSAFHGTRLDVEHIGRLMEELVAGAEARHGLDRHAIASELVFLSHETYTPARGGSAAAEVNALRRVFGADADQIVVANTKGFTGHPMGVGIEDVVAIKALETGVVPPVPNFRDPDPELGALNLSRGGAYPVSYALRLGAGFGSQISLSLLRWVPTPDGRRASPDALEYTSRVADAGAYRSWLERVTGGPAPELEIVQRTLRVKDQGLGARRAPAPEGAAVKAPAPERRPTPAPVAPVPAAPPDGDEAIRERVLGIVSEQTGYPTDMLDLDLDLEADLGIDTVKQAETFAAIREAYGIERDDTLKLRDYPTLAHAIGFVKERRPDLAGAETVGAETVGAGTVGAETAPAPAPAVVGGATQADVEPEIRGEMELALGIPRRVPVSVLRPSLEQCKPTGVVLDAKSRVVVVLDRGGVGRALVRQLEKLGVEVLALADVHDRDTLLSELARFADDRGVQGIYWLPALDAEGDHRELELAEWRAALALRVKRLYDTARALYEQLDCPERFLVAATRLGGRHGYDERGAVAPMGGGVVGFTKAFKRERPEALVKAVDFDVTRKTADLARALVAETLRDPGVVEVGYEGGRRFGVSLLEQPIVQSDEATLGSDSVYVVTGAAGSIVSAIVADLAAAGGGTFHLLDLTPEPDPTDADLMRFDSDRDGLRRAIFERLKAAGERGTPAQVERELAGIERSRAALSAIRSVERAGGTAHYHALDLTDGEAVRKVIDGIRERHGRIDVLLHAAGMERSRLLPDKEPAEFDLIFDVKCDGWFNLMRAVGDLPLGATIAFSSIAGRFGNGGQTDYSAANDLLCKCTSGLRRTHPETRGIAIDWTAWGDLGMATRGSIPQMMERAGIDMLPARAGIPIVRRELCDAAFRGELVAGERLGILVDEFDETGGLEPALVHLDTRGPMTGGLGGMGLYEGLRVVTRLDPAEQGFLHDHRIEGTAVLPGVMGIEGFVEVATLLLPDWRVRSIEDIEFLAPFKFYRDEPRELELRALLQPDGDELVAHCRLVGSRTLVGRDEPQWTTHFTGRVRLGSAPLPAQRVEAPAGSGAARVRAEDVYRIYFHGPAYRVLDSAWREAETVVGRMADALPPNHQPDSLRLRVHPRLIELCFQTAGVYEIARSGRMALPRRIDRVLLPEAEPRAPLYALVVPSGDGARSDARVVDATGNVCVVLEGYETISLPETLEQDAREPLRKAMG